MTGQSGSRRGSTVAMSRRRLLRSLGALAAGTALIGGCQSGTTAATPAGGAVAPRDAAATARPASAVGDGRAPVAGVKVAGPDATQGGHAPEPVAAPKPGLPTAAAKSPTKPAETAKPDAGHGEPAKPAEAVKRDADHGEPAKPAAAGQPPQPAKPGGAAAKPGASSGEGAVTADDALQALIDGNRRYAQLKQTRPNQTYERRVDISRGQRPIASILSCSDSRVPPELVFDQGLGDLFVVRVAGNVASEEAIGSLEYAVQHLGTQLIVVMGHKRCGAVDAAVAVHVKGVPVEGHVVSLTDAIKPAVESVRNLQTTDLVDLAVKANVLTVAAALKASKPLLAGRVQEKKVRVVGGYYDLDTGEVLYLSV